MVNIQEIASFITVVCNGLNYEDTGRGKKRVTEIEEINDGLAKQYHLPKSYIDTLEHDLALVAFATYICYFPESRIAKYSAKAAHSRLALERQLMKKYSVADFSNGDMQWVVTYNEIADFNGILQQLSEELKKTKQS